MIDSFLEFLYKILPALHVLAVIALLLKMIVIFRAKGFNIAAVFASLFRIYTRSERYMTNNINRQQYMRINNYINYYLYIWILITIIILLVFQSQ
jgi:ACR3 family arsenite efflux pump ArsB